MKKTVCLSIIFCLFLGVFAPRYVFARELNAQDKRKIECALLKMNILGNWFDVSQSVEQKERMTVPENKKECFRASQIKEITSSSGQKAYMVPLPKWFPEDLDVMEKNKVVYIEGEGTLSEASLWYRAIANVHSFLDRANKALDPNQPIVLEKLSRGYVSNRINLISNLDRLNKDLVRGKTIYNMKDHMQGRARAMLATLELINQEFYSTVESFTSPQRQKEDKYRQSVMGVVRLSNQLWNEFLSSPIPMDPLPPKTFQITEGEKVYSTVLTLLGALLAAYAVYLLLDSKREAIMEAWYRYRADSMRWAEDFNRQFLTIDVKYIVFGTLGVFALVGLLLGVSMGGFMGVLFFLMVTAAGAYVSIRMPAFVLDKLKKSRGTKINAQLMDALILLSNSLRSGMDIVQGFELVSHDLRPPISDEFGLVVKNYQLGTPFEKALEGLDDRVESRMLSYTIKAIIIQRQVGGNLTVIFARLVENIREESKLEEKLDAMTAQQKIQAIVVGIMPVIMLGVMFMFRPDEMLSFYTTPVGLFVLFGCFVWIMIGMKLIQKLGEVKV